MPLTLDEDYALKVKLEGFFSQNYATGATGPVSAYYRYPDPEERQRTFPHVTIDMIRIERESDREMRANSPFAPTQETATPQSGYVLISDDWPIPLSLIYQLRTFARLPREDRLLEIMMYQLFPTRFGYLTVQADGTSRRADLLGPPERRDSIDSVKKRLYSQIYTVAISAEMYLNQLLTIQQTSKVDITFELTNSNLNEQFSTSV